MNVTPEALQELHRIHQQLSDLRDRLERGPKQITAREANVTRLEQVLSQVQAEAKAAKVAADQKNLQLKSDEGKIKDLRTKLNQANSNREYQALLEQIAASEMANSVLSDEILDALEKVDEFDKLIAEAKQNVAKGKEELATTRQNVQSKLDQLIAEVGRLEGELQASESKLPADIRQDYERIVRSKGADGMAQIEGEYCGGCHRQITPNMYSSLKLNHAVFCKMCGRLLYLPEDRSVAGR